MNVMMVRSKLIESKVYNPDRDRVNNNYRRMLGTRPELVADIVKVTPFIEGDVDDTIRERVYCIVNMIDSTQECIECSAPVKFAMDKGRYNEFCTPECAKKSPIRAKRIAETNIERYGTVSTLQNEEVNAKARATMLERYGVEYSGQSDELLEKRAATINDNEDVTYYKSSQLTEEVYNKLNDRDWWVNALKEKWSRHEMADEVGVSLTTLHRWMKKHDLSGV